MIDTIHLELGGSDTFSSKMSFDYKKAIKSQLYYTLKQVGDVTILRSTISTPFIEVAVKGDEILNLKIQLSIPKFLYGSSYFEFIGNDITYLYNQLLYSLQKAFIRVDHDVLNCFVVTRFAICKNFYLPKNIGKPTLFLYQLQSTKLSPYYKNIKSTQFTTKSDCEKGYSLQSKSSNRITTLYDKGQEIIAEAKTKQELKIKKSLVDGVLENRILRFETTYWTRSACRYAVFGQKSKKTLYLPQLLEDDILKRLLKKELERTTNIIKIKNFDNTDTYLQLEELDRKIEATTLKEGEKAQVFRYLVHLQQIGELETSKLFKKVFRNVDSGVKIRRIKRVIKNIVTTKDINKGTFSELAEFMESHLFDLHSKKC